MWGMLAVLGVISVVLFNFIIARDMTRLLILFAVWLVLFEVLEIIVALMIVNWAHFSKPDQSGQSSYG